MSISDLGWLAQPAVFPWAALALGLCIGSFQNELVQRLPKMMERAWRADCAELAGQVLPEEPPYNLVAPRSACPGCGRGIRAAENIPLLSWLALRGKCAGCGMRISARYPLVEVLAAAGAACSAWHFGFGAAAFAGMLFIWCTLALAFIDHATGYLPDDITLPLLWAGLLFNLWGAFVPVSEAVIGAAAGYLSLWSIYWIYKLLTGKEGMGYGDFKMNAAIGAFFGWKLLPLVILVSSVVGLLFGVLQMVAAKRGWDGAFRFHFGPYLALGAIIAMFWGGPIMRWYLNP